MREGEFSRAEKSELNEIQAGSQHATDDEPGLGQRSDTELRGLIVGDPKPRRCQANEARRPQNAPRQRRGARCYVEFGR